MQPDPRSAKNMNFIATIAITLLSICSAVASDWKTAEFIADSDASLAILIPPNLSVSKYGKGKYRLDGVNSQGKVNCIFLFFEPEGTLEKSDETEWKLVKDPSLPAGTSIFEKIIRNRFEPTSQADAAMLRVRVTGKSETISAELKSVADQITKK